MKNYIKTDWVAGQTVIRKTFLDRLESFLEAIGNDAICKYNSADTYNAGDIVLFNREFWEAQQDNVTGVAPSDSASWAVFSPGGSTGGIPEYVEQFGFYNAGFTEPEVPGLFSVNAHEISIVGEQVWYDPVDQPQAGNLFLSSGIAEDGDGIPNYAYPKSGETHIGGRQITLEVGGSSNGVRIKSSEYENSFVLKPSPDEMAQDLEFHVPSRAPADGEFLTANEFGELVWETPSGGSSGMKSSLLTGVQNTINVPVFLDWNTITLSGDATLAFDVSGVSSNVASSTLEIHPGTHSVTWPSGVKGPTSIDSGKINIFTIVYRKGNGSTVADEYFVFKTPSVDV